MRAIMRGLTDPTSLSNVVLILQKTQILERYCIAKVFQLPRLHHAKNRIFVGYLVSFPATRPLLVLLCGSRKHNAPSPHQYGKENKQPNSGNRQQKPIGIQTEKPSLGFVYSMHGLHLLRAQDSSKLPTYDHLQDLLTILRDSTWRSPCSSLVFFIPVLLAASLASSFALCAVMLDTAPLTVTV
jgi:hypothetical protein